MPSNRTTSAGCISWQPCLQTKHTITPCAVLLPLSLSLKEWRHDKRFPGWHYKLQLATHDFQDSYRKLCMVFQTFKWKNYLFSKLFKVFFTFVYISKIHLKVAFMTKLLRLQVVLAAEMGRYCLCWYRYDIEILTTECRRYDNDSKVTKEWWSINQSNEKLYFPGQPHSFQGFSHTFPYLWSFSRLFKTWKISAPLLLASVGLEPTASQSAPSKLLGHRPVSMRSQSVCLVLAFCQTASEVLNTTGICNLYIYIKENRTLLSPRRPLIGSSRHFTREHGRLRGWKWSRSDVNCGFLAKVTRENSVNVSNLFIVMSDLYITWKAVSSHQLPMWLAVDSWQLGSTWLQLLTSGQSGCSA